MFGELFNWLAGSVFTLIVIAIFCLMSAFVLALLILAIIRSLELLTANDELFMPGGYDDSKFASVLSQRLAGAFYLVLFVPLFTLACAFIAKVVVANWPIYTMFPSWPF